MTRQERQSETTQNLDAARSLTDKADTSHALREELAPDIRRLLEKQEAAQLEIVAFGTISSGKSSLLNLLAGRDVFSTDLRGGTTTQRNEIPWPGHDRVTLVDTPGLGEVDGIERASEAADAARDADIVLVVVDGPLRDTEHQLLEQLSDMEKRVVICLNKEDWYGEQEREELLGQLREQTSGMVEPNDIVAVRSRTTQRRRVRVAADGSETFEYVDIPPEMEPLARRMLRIVEREGTDLLMANLLLQSRGLVDQAKMRVRETLDQRAWEIVDRYMWSAGGAAALSPFPMVDLAAGCAISTKMILDLARVYHQEVDLEIASRMLGEQGKNLLAVLGTTVATPAVAATVASMIKTVPGIGTLTGGAMQGVVQALITRWIGAVFIEYFRHEMRPPEGGLAELARRQWKFVTSASELRKLVTAARQPLDHHDETGDEEWTE